MTSARIDGKLKATVERLAAGRGEPVSTFHERALAREALRASGAPPQAVDSVGTTDDA